MTIEGKEMRAVERCLKAAWDRCEDLSERLFYADDLEGKDLADDALAHIDRARELLGIAP